MKATRLRMTKKELLKLRENTLQKLNKTIYTEEEVMLNDLLILIDESLEELANKNKVWSKIWKVLKAILTIGIPHLINALKKNK